MRMEKGIAGIIVKKREFRIRLLVIFLVLIYIPVVLNMYIVYNRTVDIVKKEKLNDIKNVMQKVTHSITADVSEVHKKACDTAENVALRKAVQDFDRYNNMQRDRLTEYYTREFDKLEENPPIIHVFCISSNGTVYFDRGKTSVDVNLLLQSQRFKDLERSRNDELWYFGDLGQIQKAAPEKEPLFFIHKLKGISTQDGKPADAMETVGFLLIVLNADFITKLDAGTALGAFNRINLCDGNLNPFRAGDLEGISAGFIDDIRSWKGGVFQKETNLAGSRSVVSIQKIEAMGWYVVNATSVDELIRPVKEALFNSLWLIVLVGGIASIWIVIEILVMTQLITDKRMVDYRLIVIEEANQKFRIYRHDFMNHLQVIQGLIQMGQPQRALDYTHKITLEGKLISNRYDIGIPELESAIFSTVAPAFEEGIEVKFDCMKLPADLPVNIYDLAKIMVNLIKNALYALKHTEAAEKILSIRIYEELGEYIFEVTNNVPVIPQALRTCIFEKGFTTKGEKGDGLGLHIVKKLVQKNLGTVELRVDGEGNRFIVRFPN